MRVVTRRGAWSLAVVLVAAAGMSIGAGVARPGTAYAAQMDDAYETPMNTELAVPALTGVLANDTPPGQTAVLNVTTTHGALVLNGDGSFTYTPDADYIGEDSFTYHDDDGLGGTSGLATVSIDVTPIANSVPNAVNDTYTTAEDETLTVDEPGVLDNDSDADDDAMTAVVATLPTYGTLELNDDGSFTYIPAPDFHGTDSFQYTALDEEAVSAVSALAADDSTATATITVTPVADPVTASTAQRTLGPAGGGKVTVDLADVVNNPDGVGLTLVSHTNGAHGTVTCVGLVCTYTPDPGFVGNDRFIYTLLTAVGGYVTGAVDVTVLPGGAAAILPITGTAPAGLLWLGLLLVVAGAALQHAARRHRNRVIA